MCVLWSPTYCPVGLVRTERRLRFLLIEEWRTSRYLVFCGLSYCPIGLLPDREAITLWFPDLLARQRGHNSVDRRLEDIKVSCLLWSVLLSCRSPARQRGYNSVVPVLLARQRGYNSVDLLTDFCSANRFDFCLNVL